jgi:diguanylate cyclase (GGDEF)-like protein/PAS domain S-box-containing protein
MHEVRGEVLSSLDLEKRKSVTKNEKDYENSIYKELVEADEQCGMIILDLKGVIRSWNSGAENITGYSSEEIIGKNYSVLYSSEDVAKAIPFATLGVTEQSERVDGQGIIVRKDGSKLAIQRTFLAQKNKIIAHLFVRDLGVSLGQDGSSLIEHLDSLTGLPNRDALLIILERELEDARRRSDILSLLSIDISQLKQGNYSGTRSHRSRMIAEIGRILRTRFRGVDTVARVDFEEFAVIIRNSTPAIAYTIGLELSQKLESFAFPGISEKLPQSIIGIASFPEHDSSATGLLDMAEIALANARYQKSSVMIYSGEQDSSLYDRPLTREDLRAGIDLNQLVLHFQPQVDLKTGVICGVEALVRWNHPVRGLLAPDLFIPLAEETGVINELTQWVMEKSISQAKIWQDEGREIVVGVNISPLSLYDTGGMVDLVEGLLNKYKLPARFLELEIVETAMAQAHEHAAFTLHALRNIGVETSLDDFGTGHSCLSQLRNLPVDRIKVDKHLIQNVGEMAEDGAIVKWILHLAQDLGLKVIAEGIESEICWNALVKIGCVMGQGYGLRRPTGVETLNLEPVLLPLN